MGSDALGQRQVLPVTSYMTQAGDASLSLYNRLNSSDYGDPK